MKKSLKKYPDGGKLYNPKLANSDLNFQSWYNKNTLEGQNNIPYSDKLSYDYYSYYRDALSTGGNPTNHFTDAYKRENHPTFSDESYYSGNGSKGYWKGEKFIKYPDGGKIGMMKARMALEAEFGNPAAKRMVSANPKRGMTPEGEGTHYMATFDNYAVPLLQDTGLDYLTYNPNPKPSKEDMRFESAEDAEYFAKHYKEIAPMMRTFKKGGIIRYDLGGPVKNTTSSLVNMAVPGLGTAVSAIDSITTNPDGSPKSGAINEYISRTNPLTNLGRIADGKDVGRSLLGLTGVGGMMEVTGLNDKLFGESDYDKEARKALEAKKSLDFTKVRMGQANTSIDTLGTTQNNMYPHGGVVTTDQPGALAELELQEQMQLPNGVVMGVDGPSHEQGGIEVNVPEGTRVFSDRLKHNGKTFAKHAKSINNKIAKLDNKPVSTATQNTEMLLNKQLDGLFNAQEEMKIVKEQNKQRKMFSKGGVIPAHNVTLMKKGGLTHYSGLDGDPSVIQNGFFANLRENALYKNAFDANKNYSFDLKSPAANNNYLGKTSNSATTGNSNLPASFWGNSFAKGAQSVYGDVGNAGLSGSMTESGAVDGASKFSMSPQNSALATQLLSNIIQNQQISGIKKPRTINPVSFTAGARPDLVDYSNERAAIDSEVAGARAGVRLGSGSYSTQAANLQKIRNQQLMNKGRSFQTERNANVQLNNAYKGQQANAYNQGVQANLGIDQYNLENEFNYNLWKTGQKLKSTGSTADTMTNVFNNQTGYQNQKDYWEVMKQMYDPKVAEDIKLPKRKLGGKIKRK